MSNGDIFAIEKIVEAIIKYSKDAQVMQVLKKSGYDIVSYKPMSSGTDTHDTENVVELCTEGQKTRFSLFVVPETSLDRVKGNKSNDKEDDKPKSIFDNWSLILEQLKKMSIEQYAYLENAKPIFASKDSLYVLFPDMYKVHKNKLQANTEKFVDVIKKIMMQNMQVVYILQEELVDIEKDKDFAVLKM